MLVPAAGSAAGVINALSGNTASERSGPRI
jgi:hypothetical protein